MRKFKVGDKVEIIDNTCCHGFEIGQKVKITSIRKNNFLKAEGNNIEWALGAEDVKLIKSNKPKQMKLKKKQQKFIKKAYNSNDVCQQWKDDIKKNFPKLFKDTELVVGEWYKLNTNYCKLRKGMIFQFLEYQSGVDSCFAIVDHAAFGIDTYNYLVPSTETLIPATKEEVETALIAEAKRRGFKEGVVFEAIDYTKGEHCKILDSDIYYDDGEDENLHFRTDACKAYRVIFSKGKWATIVKETITKAEAEKQLNKTII